jgi:hypothetical protein
VDAYPPRPSDAQSQEAHCLSGRPETLLEMARRHVCEGVIRVARQEEIVAALDRDTSYRSQAALAREILVSLNSSLNLMKHHLRSIEERRKT